MTLPSSPPITLQQIQSEFGVSSLSDAGLAYFGRANCNMLEFLGASAFSYNFGNYSASGSAYGPYGNNASASVIFYSDGTVHEYVHSEYQNGSSDADRPYTWLLRGNASLVEAYVTQSGYVTPGGYVSEPTLNTWIPIGNVGFGTSIGPSGNNSGYQGSWVVQFRYNGGPVVASSSVSVAADYYPPSGGTFGTSYGPPSDIRLKRDIVLLETRADGIKVYSFRYKTSEEFYVGVMAQDLLGTPWESAVGTDSNGFYFVDYSKLPVKFELLKK